MKPNRRAISTIVAILCSALLILASPSCNGPGQLFEPLGTIHVENVRGVGLAVTERTRAYVEADPSVGEQERSMVLTSIANLEEALRTRETITGVELSPIAMLTLNTHDRYVRNDLSLTDNARSIRLEDSKRLREVIQSGQLHSEG